MMRGYALIVGVLHLAKKAKTVRQIYTALAVNERSARNVVWELNEAGLLERVGTMKLPRGGCDPVLYQTRFVEAELVGRAPTKRFLRLWNAMLVADSAANIGADAGLHERVTRRVIKSLHAAGLCRIAAWQRGRVSVPAALYEIGNKSDAPRPQRMSMKEYNARASARRKQRRVLDALHWLGQSSQVLHQ